MWPIIVLLLAIVLAFFTIRVLTDAPNIAAGVVPEDGYERRYAEHPLIAYAHIVPGVIYIVGAPFQLSRRFREANVHRHRLLGRVLLPVGLLAGVFGVGFGVPYSFGGITEATAAAVFGSWFVVALLLAYRAIRAGDVTAHRRWMIRAFAIGLAAGTIRIWIGLFQGFGVLSFEDSFGPAFWLGFGLHAVVAELYLARRPGVDREVVRTA